MQQNGWHMHRWKAKKGGSDVVNTGPYMQKVREGIFWLPKTDAVNFKPLTHPPSKAIIWAELKRLIY